MSLRINEILKMKNSIMSKISDRKEILHKYCRDYDKIIYFWNISVIS